MTTGKSRCCEYCREKISEIIAALKRLKEDRENAFTRSDAGFIFERFYHYLLFFCFYKSFFPEINDAQKYLQTKLVISTEG